MPRKTNEESKVIKNQKISGTKSTKSNSKNVTKSKVVTNSKSKKVDSSKSLKNNNSKSTSKKKIPTRKTTTKLDLIEYYDLPYRYNKTIAKILAQTPKKLFVYWDISDEDRNNYEKEYGPDFFNSTKPVLIVHNTTKNYSFEIEINDFANSWYFDVNDEKSEYIVELGRRPKSNTISIPNNYLYITSSNKIESPNNHILFEKEQEIVYFRNIKTNEETSKDITNFNLLRYMGKAHKAHSVYTIPKIYSKIYKDENLLDLKNPTSSM